MFNVRTQTLKRVPYLSDVRYPKFEFYELHPIHTRVCKDRGAVVSLCVNWPLQGVTEKENSIVIPASHADYQRLKSVSPCVFPVYVWDSIARVGYARGKFSISGSASEFVLRRSPDPASVAAEAMQKVNTKLAIERALEPRAEEVQVKKYNGFSRPTVYKGVEYRSMAEARFAIALDAMNIPFSFETMSFKRPGGGRYTPDFFLPQQQLLVELKPSRPLVEEEEKCEEMSQSGFRIVCMYGQRIGTLPFAYQTGRKRDYGHRDGLRGIAWHNGEKLAGEVAFVVGKNPKPSPSPLEMIGDTSVPHLDVVCSSKDARWNVATVQSALEAAGAMVSE